MDGFLRPISTFALPDRYAMFSDEGDLLVKGALAEFLPAANNSAAEAGLSTFHERLSALQDFDVQSAGGSYVDDYLGWAEPEDYDASGAVRPRHPTPNTLRCSGLGRHNAFSSIGGCSEEPAALHR